MQENKRVLFISIHSVLLVSLLNTVTQHSKNMLAISTAIIQESSTSHKWMHNNNIQRKSSSQTQLIIAGKLLQEQTTSMSICRKGQLVREQRPFCQ